MPPRSRTTRAAIATKKPQGTLARLRAKARKDATPEAEPYVINDVEPPIAIRSPNSAEQQIALAAFFENEGAFRISEAKAVLEVICGDAFDRVWEMFRREDLALLMALIDDVGRHFQEQNLAQDGDEDDEDVEGD